MKKLKKKHLKLLLDLDVLSIDFYLVEDIKQWSSVQSIIHSTFRQSSNDSNVIHQRT